MHKWLSTQKHVCSHTFELGVVDITVWCHGLWLWLSIWGDLVSHNTYSVSHTHTKNILSFTVQNSTHRHISKYIWTAKQYGAKVHIVLLNEGVKCSTDFSASLVLLHTKAKVAKWFGNLRSVFDLTILLHLVAVPELSNLSHSLPWLTGFGQFHTVVMFKFPFLEQFMDLFSSNFFALTTGIALHVTQPSLM